MTAYVWVKVLLTWIASATCLHNTQFQLATEGMLDELGAGSSGWRETRPALFWTVTMASIGEGQADHGFPVLGSHVPLSA